jgi:hypothetical protein
MPLKESTFSQLSIDFGIAYGHFYEVIRKNGPPTQNTKKRCL